MTASTLERLSRLTLPCSCVPRAARRVPRAACRAPRVACCVCLTASCFSWLLILYTLLLTLYFIPYALYLTASSSPDCLYFILYSWLYTLYFIPYALYLTASCCSWLLATQPSRQRRRSACVITNSNAASPVTLYRILYTLHFILYTLYFILYILGRGGAPRGWSQIRTQPRRLLWRGCRRSHLLHLLVHLYFILYTLYFILYTLYLKLYTVYFIPIALMVSSTLAPPPPSGSILSSVVKNSVQ